MNNKKKNAFEISGKNFLLLHSLIHRFHVHARILFYAFTHEKKIQRKVPFTRSRKPLGGTVKNNLRSRGVAHVL